MAATTSAPSVPWLQLCEATVECDTPSYREELRSLLASNATAHAVLRFERGDGARTVHFSAVCAPELTGEGVLLVVCHDLTDFKERVELEKDRQLIRPWR